MKAKKGALCAFEVRTLAVHPSERVGVPATVERSTCWYVGIVHAATREGRVREVSTVEGDRFKMDAKLLRVTRVLCIPPDKVSGPALLSESCGQSWETVSECEAFVTRFLAEPVTPLMSPPESER